MIIYKCKSSILIIHFCLQSLRELSVYTNWTRKLLKNGYSVRSVRVFESASEAKVRRDSLDVRRRMPYSPLADADGAADAEGGFGGDAV